ncbi:hypothetical protein RU95_GL000786 [Enterococcus avium]|nr:hypothetical protein RU95_GL000786 [Enterococcus avium]
MHEIFFISSSANKLHQQEANFKKQFKRVCQSIPILFFSK